MAKNISLETEEGGMREYNMWLVLSFLLLQGQLTLDIILPVILVLALLFCYQALLL